MSSLFEWLKSAFKGPGNKDTDHNPVKEQSDLSKSILHLMKQKKAVTKGYYSPKSDTESPTNDSNNKPKP